jgi:hypothetical protein
MTNGHATPVVSRGFVLTERFMGIEVPGPFIYTHAEFIIDLRSSGSSAFFFLSISSVAWYTRQCTCS